MPERERIIFHIDVNSAYLSWTALEQLKNGSSTDLRTIPSIIGGDEKSRHGVVLAKSIPAKKYGIQTGEPVAAALRKCPGLVMASPDHRLYREYSRAMIRLLIEEFSPELEQVSIDECYMDFTSRARFYASPEEAAGRIRDRIFARFGFTVNVGISTVKVLAKMASDFEKPGKVHTLYPEEIEAKMWPLPVSELFMVGGRSASKLKSLGVLTIGDLARSDPAFLNAHGVSAEPVYWPDEKPDAHNNVMKMIADHAFDLIVNIPKNHTKRELTNGYKIRRGAIDHNIPLITNARLASAFIEAFCDMKMEDIQIKSWQEYK